MRYLIYLILVVSTSLHAGTIHKWIDEDGNVHYSDAPPAATKTEGVRVQSAPSNPGRPLPRLSDEQGGDSAAAGVGAGAGADKQKVASEQAAAICERARNDLDILDNNTNIRLHQADGTTRNLDQVEIGQRRTRAQAEIERYCN
jgi:hypothetical protein